MDWTTALDETIIFPAFLLLKRYEPFGEQRRCHFGSTAGEGISRPNAAIGRTPDREQRPERFLQRRRIIDPMDAL
jgi:hypothetical protein